MGSLSTAASGGQFRRPGSSDALSSPTGLPTESASSRRSAAARRKSAELFAFDSGLGVDWVVGADEAGRGCLAGPIVAAAVAFGQTGLGSDELESLSDLDDSKKRKGERRSKLFEAIQVCASAVAVAIRPAAWIDLHGLHRTNKAALADAAARVGRADGVVMTDGFEVDLPWGPSVKLVKGDSTSAAIAAASIVAKETRDRWMKTVADELFPGYGFAEHVGYATESHRQAIVELGPCALHRRSFNSSAYHSA